MPPIKLGALTLKRMDISVLALSTLRIAPVLQSIRDAVLQQQRLIA